MHELKDKILKQAKKELDERGPDRMDVDRIGKMVDMVKDLAEAAYYCSITEAMGVSSGYGGGTGSSAGYQRGYMGHQDILDPLGKAMRDASPDERERLRNEVLKAIGRL